MNGPKFAAAAAAALVLWLLARRPQVIGGDVVASNIVNKNGRCYRVDTLRDGSKVSVAVAGWECEREGIGGPAGLDESDELESIYQSKFGPLFDLFADDVE